jgi:uncharacterized protein YndB with AHSA1/START domain
VQYLKDLKATLPNDLEVQFTRGFDATRPLVWDAMTKPELIKRWLFGPPGWTMTVCEDEQRVGGTFRWAWRGPNGEEMAMHGVHKEIVVPERGVRTEIFDFGCNVQAGEQLATMVLSEQGDQTLMTLTLRFKSKECRDGAVASGMEGGKNAGYARLDEILAEG